MRGDRGVEWLTMDAARAAKTIGTRADLTVCLNVITSASAPVRNAQWAGVASITKPTGHALLVLPSLESEEMLQRQSLRDTRNEKFEITDEGLVETEGSFQKHYRQDEVSRGRREPRARGQAHRADRVGVVTNGNEKAPFRRVGKSLGLDRAGAAAAHSLRPRG